MELAEYLTRMFNQDGVTRDLFQAIRTSQMAAASDELDTCEYHIAVNRAARTAVEFHGLEEHGYRVVDVIKTAERLIGQAA